MPLDQVNLLMVLKEMTLKLTMVLKKTLKLTMMLMLKKMTLKVIKAEGVKRNNSVKLYLYFVYFKRFCFLSVEPNLVPRASN